MSEPRILVTNDDGIESPGFRALYDAMDDIGDAVAVAPHSNQSAVGRAMSNEVVVHEYDLGYAIEGTPADCVVAGLEALHPDADVVVAGVNKGANLGQYVLGRSGTVSAAVEAAFFDVPAMAVSQYMPRGPDEWADLGNDPEDYRLACEAAAYLVEHTLDAGVFDVADYLNVNAPAQEDAVTSHSADAGDDDPRPEMVVTSPSKLYDMTADHEEDGTIYLRDRVWRRMREGDIPDPDGTDRRTVVDGKISVSPLTAPHSVQHNQALDGIADAFLD